MYSTVCTYYTIFLYNIQILFPSDYGPCHALIISYEMMYGDVQWQV